LGLNPVNWPQLASPDFSRSDLAAELYGETLFDGRIFADLSQSRQRPFVIINATNLGQIEKLVVIVVNTRTEDQDVISRKESPPKLDTVAY
jgi:hypothetical protein